MAYLNGYCIHERPSTKLSHLHDIFKTALAVLVTERIYFRAVYVPVVREPVHEDGPCKRSIVNLGKPKADRGHGGVKEGR